MKNSKKNITLLFKVFGILTFLFSIFICLNSIIFLLSSNPSENNEQQEENNFQKNINALGEEFDNKMFDSSDYPVDIVYTWVNGSDPRHLERLHQLKEEKLRLLGKRFCEKDENQDDNDCIDDDDPPNRFKDNEELRYSLRSIMKNLPWFRKIYLVTNGQVPYWLNTTNPKLEVITHEQIFKNPDDLPTFSSPAIEANLHRIPGLSRKFLYLNDDVMFGSAVTREDFYTRSRGQKIYLSWPVPDCALGCQSSWIGDSFCDRACNVTECSFDAGDCEGKFANENEHNFNNNNNFNHYYNDNCENNCPISWVGDGYCDSVCNTKKCAFDFGDCGWEEIKEKIQSDKLVINEQNFHLPHNIREFYLDISPLIGQTEIVYSSHDNLNLIRGSMTSQSEKLVLFLFHGDEKETSFSLLFEDKNGNEYTCSFIKESPTIQTTIQTTEQNNENNNENNENQKKFNPSTSRDLKTFSSKDLEKGKDISYSMFENHRFTFRQRKPLLDVYGRSLVFVNSLLTNSFGRESRRVPAHMAHFLDKKVILEMMDFWKDEFEATSSHKLRDPHDMQYAFSYYMFYTSARKELNLEEVWKNYLDSDEDGKLNDIELRNLGALILELPMDDDQMPELKSLLLPYTSDNKTITISTLESCEIIYENLKLWASEQKKYKTETFVEPPEIGFSMVSNHTIVLPELDQYRLHRPKFLCLNDNIDYTNEESEIIIQDVHDFYESLFPLKSPFELDSPNPSLYIDEIKEILNNNNKNNNKKTRKDKRNHIITKDEEENQPIIFSKLLFMILGFFFLLATLVLLFFFCLSPKKHNNTLKAKNK